MSIGLKDEELIDLLAQKDESAFRVLVERYEQKVYNTVIGFLRSDDFADDVAQEVFIAVYQSIGSFRRDAALSTWIYRIAVTKSLEFLRKQKRKKRWGLFYSLFDDDGQLRYDAGNNHHPGVALEDKETAQALFAAIDKLPDQQRTAFTLLKVEGMSYDEVAQVMSATVSSVESLIQRAQGNLRKYLADYYKSM
jgi:RNA polymerase sigma factor, sigma-70 family